MSTRAWNLAVWKGHGFSRAEGSRIKPALAAEGCTLRDTKRYRLQPTGYCLLLDMALQHGTSVPVARSRRFCGIALQEVE